MVKVPNPFALCRNETPRSTLSAKIGVQGRQMLRCSPYTPHPGRAATHGPSQRR